MTLHSVVCECGWKLHATIGAELKCGKCGQLHKLAGDDATSAESALWNRMHLFAPESTQWNPQAALDMLREIREELAGLKRCSCGQDWDTLLDLFPPRTESAVSFFEWTVDVHNIVNGKLDKPQVRLVDAYASYWNRVPQRRPNLMISVATGSYLQYFDIIRPSLEHYADKVDADLVCLINKTQSWWGYEKFRVQEFVPLYDRTLFVDSDVVISKGCPSIFDMVPYEDIGIHDDLPWIPDRDWFPPQKRAVCESQGVYELLGNVILNTGIVACNRHHNVWQMPQHKLPEKHCDEQFWVEQTILREGYTYTKLPIEFNTQWWMHDFRRLRPSAQILHLANSLSKTQDLSLAMREYFYDYQPNRQPKHHHITSRF